VVGFCEDGGEILGSVKYTELFDWLKIVGC